MCAASAAESFLRARLNEALAPEHLEIADESHLHAGHAGANAAGSGSHFRVRIVSAAFDGLAPVQRHRLVYQALRQDGEAAALGFGIHALALNALSPREAAA